MTDVYSDTYWTTEFQIVQAALTRIAATDRLIDLIMYRLYRLTEEDAVVEGTAP